ncbi:MAG: hypothetical protein ACKVQR_12425, partial [Aquabacterium sp.]
VALQQDRDGVGGRLRRETYAQAALVPATPWLAAPAPLAAPQWRLDAAGAVPRLQLSLPDAATPLRWAVWRRHDGRWQFSTQPGTQQVVALAADPLGVAPDAVVVSAVDRYGQEGPRLGLALAAVLAA